MCKLWCLYEGRGSGLSLSKLPAQRQNLASVLRITAQRPGSLQGAQATSVMPSHFQLSGREMISRHVDEVAELPSTAQPA